ncbi:UDP-N-acetylenolpyruvoylglucosamine reductase, partial [Candidatus Kaiserbacteria bacterium]|nr:UDP-N-acetylenolpyruvoylglucosamine reductase [Candidatus Kaiserbacteria bacterium]
FVVTVRAYNVTTGEGREFANAECDFSYRHSFFKDHPEWIITRAILRLTTVEPSESRRLVDETINERERRHLQNVQAAGSYFMNPVAPHRIVEMFEAEKGVKSRENRVPAGWLIEKAGMKGATVGGAIASLQHPNYIVNTGSATAEDVKKLADTIKAAVQKEFDITLREEAALL